MSRDTGKRRRNRHRGRARALGQNMVTFHHVLYGGKDQVPVIFPKPPVGTVPDETIPYYAFIGPPTNETPI